MIKLIKRIINRLGEVRMGNLIYEDLTYKIRKSLFSVYNELGPGFREETYKQAVMIDFKNAGVPFEHEKIYDVRYLGEKVDKYRVDILVYDKIILELKAVSELHPRFDAQLLSYLKVAQLKIGLLVNFGNQPLAIRRFVNPHIDNF